MTFDTDYTYTYSTADTTGGGQTETYAYTYTYPTYPTTTTDYPIGGGGGGKYPINNKMNAPVIWIRNWSDLLQIKLEKRVEEDPVLDTNYLIG